MRKYLYNLATDKAKGVIPFFLRPVLFLLSLAYGAVVIVLSSLCRAFRKEMPCKVISVGNITLGGTGKTVLVEHIARYLQEKGHKGAVLSRGYKKQASGFRLQASGYEAMGDEPYMLREKLKDIPVIVGADRARAARRAVKDYGADTVILDDAFQQWKIKKDLEIVAIDAVNPFGNKQLIPRGILREPLSSLKRADIFILAKTNLSAQTGALKSYLNRINPKAAVFESEHRPAGFYKMDNPRELLTMDSLKGKTVAIFSGIGDPASFEGLIKASGINTGLTFEFPDHHCYAEEEIDKIIRDSRDKNIDMVITTEKDAVRLSGCKLQAASCKLLVLRIEIFLKEEYRFHDRLAALYTH